MAYYAEIDDNNVVTQVYKVNNEVITTNGVEDHQKGIDFLKNIYGSNKNFLRTSYGTYLGIHYDVNPVSSQMTESADQSKAFRKNYAGKGSIYHPNLDAFSPPKPYPSWVLDENTAVWRAPVAIPTDGQEYDWDEATTSWVLKS